MLVELPILTASRKFVTPVKTGVQKTYNYMKKLGSGTCTGPDPGFAGMTEKRNFQRFAS
jgi:hypothetical protein